MVLRFSRGSTANVRRSWPPGSAYGPTSRTSSPAIHDIISLVIVRIGIPSSTSDFGMISLRIDGGLLRGEAARAAYGRNAGGGGRRILDRSGRNQFGDCF